MERITDSDLLAWFMAAVKDMFGFALEAGEKFEEDQSKGNVSLSRMQFDTLGPYTDEAGNRWRMSAEVTSPWIGWERCTFLLRIQVESADLSRVRNTVLSTADQGNYGVPKDMRQDAADFRLLVLQCLRGDMMVHPVYYKPFIYDYLTEAADFSLGCVTYEVN